jgi:hypothetical protein
MFRGYLHDEERYRKCFREGWYLTGDLAMRDEEGYFHFVARADDIVKTSGHMVGPSRWRARSWSIPRSRRRASKPSSRRSTPGEPLQRALDIDSYDFMNLLVASRDELGVSIAEAITEKWRRSRD